MGRIRDNELDRFGGYQRSGGSRNKLLTSSKSLSAEGSVVTAQIADTRSCSTCVLAHELPTQKSK